jgi:hypothetical protein
MEEEVAYSDRHGVLFSPLCAHVSQVRNRIANAKSVGWAIYVAGFAIWLFGYLSAGHAPLFDWDAATPWWIFSFVPNVEAEHGLALMFASMTDLLARTTEATVMRGVCSGRPDPKSEGLPWLA